ncbi:MAG: hypothetical protein WKF70_11810, partial [Chitinophagaceae bacterium]
MKKSFLYCLLFISALTAFVACQKELSLENPAPAVATLQADSSGDCLPKIVTGTYVAGRAMSDSNSIEIDVKVTTPGSYVISSDTINGYSFKATGNFTAAGVK